MAVRVCESQGEVTGFLIRRGSPLEGWGRGPSQMAGGGGRGGGVSRREEEGRAHVAQAPRAYPRFFEDGET